MSHDEHAAAVEAVKQKYEELKGMLAGALEFASREALPMVFDAVGNDGGPDTADAVRGAASALADGNDDSPITEAINKTNEVIELLGTYRSGW